jgi:hypothetical protein
MVSSKEVEMGSVCSRTGRSEVCRILVKPERKKSLGDLSIDGSVIVK